MEEHASALSIANVAPDGKVQNAEPVRTVIK